MFRILNGYKNRIEELRGVIKHHDYKHYSEASPEISDYEIDPFLNELKGLETEYPELIAPDSPTEEGGRVCSRGVQSSKAQESYA